MKFENESKEKYSREEKIEHSGIKATIGKTNVSNSDLEKAARGDYGSKAMKQASFIIGNR